MNIEPITIIDAVDNFTQFRFHRINHDLVKIEMTDAGTWLIVDPIYTRWLINFILGNPRFESERANRYEFSPKPGDMTVDTIPLYITHTDLQRLQEWLAQ